MHVREGVYDNNKSVTTVLHLSYPMYNNMGKTSTPLTSILVCSHKRLEV